MKAFRSLEEVRAATLPDGVFRAVYETLERFIGAYEEYGMAYVPEDAGHVVLVEAGDTDEVLRAGLGGYTLQDALFEGAVYDHGCFLTCILFNNEYGLSIIVPDAPWLDPGVRARLTEEM